MKKILITLIIMSGFCCLSFNAQKPLKKPTKQPQKTQTATSPKKEPVKTHDKPATSRKPQKPLTAPKKKTEQSGVGKRNSSSIHKNTTNNRRTIQNKKYSISSLSLACDVEGTRRYYNVNEWKNLSIEEKLKCDKLGLVIESGGKRFMIALNNNMSNRIYDQGVDKSTVTNKTQGQLPSSTQLWTITHNLSTVNAALKVFGGERFCYQPYWCKDGTQVDLGNNGLHKPYDGMFRLSTDNIEQGFIENEVAAPINGKYDFVGELSCTDIQLVRHKDKYGFIDKKGRVSVPVEYDEVGYNDDWQNHKAGNDNMEWGYSILMSVSKNGKWGFVNKHGKLVTPLIYDAVDYMGSDDNTPVWVSKEGRYGCIDTLGNYVIPMIYENEIKFYNFVSFPSRAKKNGKWGFIRKNGEVAIPFKYDSTRGFSDDKVGLAQVSLNNKYGYINESGEVVIPIKYEFADQFASGLAGVVVNGKVGFIDANGNMVVPCIYDLQYSSDGNGKCLCWSEYYGRVALVKKNGKWGMINKKGEPVTQFKYDWFSSASTNGNVTAILDGKTIFLDKGGNEYPTEEIREQQSDSILSIQGYPYEQFKMGKKEYDKENYAKAYPWIKKSAAGGDDDGQCHLGYYYFYGYSPVQESYPIAYKWFLKAAEQDNNDACYFLGWMHEHDYSRYGIQPNKQKAIEWYMKSKGQRDSEERIKKLSE